jgi:tetratricopeptide (TPR) repeat protein
LRKYPQRAKALEAYHRGVFAEYDGCQKGEFLTITGLTESGGNLVQRYFVPATRELDSALALEPDLHDAALHLGRVRMLESAPDAAKWFERAAQSPSRATAYLAHLFLGAFAERASRWSEAETEYRAAIRLFPTGQSAAIALAQFLDRRDQPADGSRTLAGLFAPARARVVDPWWVYFEEAGAENASRIAMMRAEVIK